MNQQASHFVGLISGTSADGVDAAAVRFIDGQCHIDAFHTYPYPTELINQLQPLLDAQQCPDLLTLGSLDAKIADAFELAARTIIEQAGWSSDNVVAIGSHGQTICHGADANPPFSLQLGDPNRIAYQTDIPVVADFRRMDLAAGGQAAPFAPLIHAALFHQSGYAKNTAQAVVNIGGIANITWLPKTADSPILGFDCGPGNCLMDAWCRLQRQQAYDPGGHWAASGQAQSSLLATLLQDEYLQRLPPKSTGREYFTLQWLLQYCSQLNELKPADVQATLLQLTATSICVAIASCGQPERIIICGGGVHNHVLMQALAEQLPDSTVISSTQLGVSADAMEALLFAWLAKQRITEQLIDTRSITGASEPVLLGSIFRSR